MARTTDLLVKGIVEVDEDAVPDLSPFIDSANMLVTEACVPLGYDDTRLEMIERWLAAHFYAVRDPRPKMQQVSTIREEFETKVGYALDNTRYGQQAKILDTKGGLAAIQNQQVQTVKRKKGIIWLGTEDE